MIIFQWDNSQKKTPIVTSNNIVDQEIISKTLGLKAYDSLEVELNQLQDFVKSDDQIIYFKKKKDSIFISLLKSNNEKSTLISFVLDGSSKYDFTQETKHIKTLFQKSNIFKVFNLNEGQTWDSKRYISAKFSNFLNWENNEFKLSFEVKKEEITYKNSAMNRNDSQLIHFFLWTTIEYMEFNNKDEFYYEVINDNDSMKVNSKFLSINHSEKYANHVKDSINSVKEFIQVKENAIKETFHFTKNNTALVLTSKNNIYHIPYEFDNILQLNRIRNSKNKNDIEKNLTPIIEALKKNDKLIESWSENKHQSEKFNEFLDLNVKISQWKYFVSKNKEKNLYLFFLETILFQLEESNSNTISLEVNTVSSKISSKLGVFQNYLLLIILLCIGIACLLLLVFEKFISKKIKNIVTKKSAKDTQHLSEVHSHFSIPYVQETHWGIYPIYNKKIDDSPTFNEEEAKKINSKIEQFKNNKKNNRTSKLSSGLLNHISQNDIQKITTFDMCIKLPWNKKFETLLNDIFDSHTLFQNLKSEKNTTDFLKNIQDKFPEHEDYITDLVHSKSLWDEMRDAKTSKELKGFIKKELDRKNAKIINEFITIGIAYEDLSKVTSFDEAIKALETHKKFKKEANRLLNLTNDKSSKSIADSIDKIVDANGLLLKGINDSKSISEILPYFEKWHNSLSNKSSKWKNSFEKLSSNQKNVANESDILKKLHLIQNIYNVFTDKEDKALTEFISHNKTKISELEESASEKLNSTIKEFENTINLIKEEAKREKEEFTTAKKAIEKNLKFAKVFSEKFYDPHIKELLNKADKFDNTELTKRITFIACNAIDFTNYINNNWKLNKKNSGNIKNIIYDQSLETFIEETYNPDKTPSSYINTMINYLDSNGVKQIDYLIDGVNVNKVLKKLN